MTDKQELATVHRLPVDAEIVTEEQWREKQHRDAARARRDGYLNDVATITRATRKVATHPHTVATSKTIARHSWYVVAGAWTTITLGRHDRQRPRRMARQAELEGNTEELKYWFEADEQARDRRHKRFMNYINTPLEWLRAFLLSAIVGSGLLLALGIVVACYRHDWTWVFAPLIAAGAAIAFLVTIVTFLWAVLPAAFLACLIVACWHRGRKASVTPDWMTSDNAVTDDTVTPMGIARALAHLGVTELNKAIKDGWTVEFLQPPTLVNNRGYHAVFSLPMGVTPSRIADKRDVLARNLLRAPLEVWPTDYTDRAGFVDLWVAHPGATGRNMSAYPLLDEGTVDVFDGVPFGESQRGDLVAPPLTEASMGVGGLPGQGKSNAVRVIMAGAALDPLAVLRVYVFAGNGDFDAYAPRLDRYRRGSDDSVVEDAVSELRGLYAEVERREGRLAELGAKKLSRQIAAKHEDMRPIIVAFSECHELFGHPDLGKSASELAIVTVKRMRKCGIFMVFDTQSSRAAAIPTALVELFKYNSCFAVKTWRSNDGFLGDGSFQSGVRATELRPGKDRGTSLVTGCTDERFEIVRWYYLEANDDTGYDAATDVIERAMQIVKPYRQRAEAEVARDLLVDVAEELCDQDRMRCSDMASLLRTLDPRDSVYRNLDGKKLASLLEAEQVRVTALDGYPMVYATRVHTALDARDE